MHRVGWGRGREEGRMRLVGLCDFNFRRALQFVQIQLHTISAEANMKTVKVIYRKTCDC